MKINEILEYVESIIKDVERRYLKFNKRSENKENFSPSIQLRTFIAIYKYVKTVDVIKQKEVDTSLLRCAFENDAYLNGYNILRSKAKQLTKEEFKLLKEVLTDNEEEENGKRNV